MKDSPYNLRCDKDYYNDLPGKVPPDLLFDSDLAQSLSHLDVKVWKVLTKYNNTNNLLYICYILLRSRLLMIV